ncbi:sensor histidine kinase [Aureliella helgolandensis]|uniref:histidine kinase n=1 Tax=Aureliella helgolandensis TaxID=2527968 RepID=A0A518GEX1_9BACT|nr:HAMP domain-containing sensor histidine kinase [Aureliella helgolandensis]QDV27107.1 Sensor protein ZraS [Aureliella helgolandensis]
MNHASAQQAPCFSGATVAQLHAIVLQMAAPPPLAANGPGESPKSRCDLDSQARESESAWPAAEGPITDVARPVSSDGLPPHTPAGRQLLSLAAQDPHFAAWCRSHQCPIDDNSTTAGIASAEPIAIEACDQFARALPQLLIRHSAWLPSPVELEPSQPSPAKLLMDTAHLVVRLQTVQERFTAELQTRKQAAIYNFAYGLSHELNNPLANIATRAGVLLQDESAAERRTMLSTIIDNAMRGCEMLGDLMQVARPPVLAPQPVRLASLLEELQLKIAPLASSRNIDVHWQTTLPTDQVLETDPSALKEVLWCLVRNAIEALGERGTISINATLAVESPFNATPMICLEVLDDGPGLSPHALANCFDPYFSGREAGRGLGLGLSKSQRIIEQFGGTLTLANGPARGCRVTIWLPVSPST